MSMISNVCNCTEIKKLSDLIKQAILIDDDGRWKLNVNFTSRENCENLSSIVENCTEFIDLEESACALFTIDECDNVALNIVGDICNICNE